MRQLIVTVLLLAIVCGCNAGTSGAESRAPETITLPGPASRGATASPSVSAEPIPPPCVLGGSSIRLRIDPGQSIPTGTGIDIGNEGVSHDNFGPAGFDFNVSLVFRRGAEEDRVMPSFRDRGPHVALGHCYRLLDLSAGTVLLEVSPIVGGERDGGPDGELEGFGGTPPPGAAACTVTDANGPLPGGEGASGCAENEVCVCEVQAGYGCRGRCAPEGKARGRDGHVHDGNR